MGACHTLFSVSLLVCCLYVVKWMMIDCWVVVFVFLDGGEGRRVLLSL